MGFFYKHSSAATRNTITQVGRSNARAHRTRAALRLAAALSLSIVVAGCAEMTQVLQSGTQASGGSSQSALTRGIKESLELSSTRAADLLSKTGAYRTSTKYRIQLPQNVQPLASRLRQFGLGGQIDNIELLMNQAAEQAAVEAKGVFVDAVRTMSITDALGIIRGSNTAATDYFKQHTEASLRQRYLPIVQRNLQQIGFYQYYQELLGAYKLLPLANKPDLDLEQHVLTRSLDGLFAQVAEEEKLIRLDPIGRGSSAIAAVFGLGAPTR